MWDEWFGERKPAECGRKQATSRKLEKHYDAVVEASSREIGGAPQGISGG